MEKTCTKFRSESRALYLGYLLPLFFVPNRILDKHGCPDVDAIVRDRGNREWLLENESRYAIRQCVFVIIFVLATVAVPYLVPIPVFLSALFLASHTVFDEARRITKQ